MTLKWLFLPTVHWWPIYPSLTLVPGPMSRLSTPSGQHRSPQPPLSQTPHHNKTSSSASSLIDLSQSQIRLSPLERTTSHISLNYGPKQEESRRLSPDKMSRSTPGGGARPKMTRSQSHISTGSGHLRPVTVGSDPLNLGHMSGTEHLDR